MARVLGHLAEGTEGRTVVEATKQRILDAAFACVADHGLAATSLEDVAERAGVSRQTLYRHFGSREGVMEALVVREERWFIGRVVQAAEDHDNLEEAVGAAVAAALQAAMDHPLLQRLLEAEPGAIMPLMVGGSGPVISEARPVVANILRTHVSVGDAEIEDLADVCSRLIVSYVLDPSHLGPDEIGRRIARIVAGAVGDAASRARASG